MWGLKCGVREVRVDVDALVVDLPPEIVGHHLVSRFAFIVLELLLWVLGCFVRWVV